MHTTETAVTARTLGMEYEAAEIRHHTGVKNRYIGRDIYARGRRIVGGGYGTYVTATYAHLKLDIEVNGERFSIWTERDFREVLNVKRLTAEVREQISQTMPEIVGVEEREGRRGTKYYALTEAAITEWAARITSPVGCG